MRYTKISSDKANGVVYTPLELADYLSERMVDNYNNPQKNDFKILDPAIGGGELVISIINKLLQLNQSVNISIYGYETDGEVVKKTEKMLKDMFPSILIDIRNEDFLSQINSITDKFDFIIANPPYIRTQILGADKAQKISEELKLSGRIDIYYAFLIEVKKVMKDDGVAGFITSNKFFTIKSGKLVREYLLNNYVIDEIVDFGDSKLFTASVLPCTLVFHSKKSKDENTSLIKFTSIYETKENTSRKVKSLFDEISKDGIIEIPNGRKFSIQIGFLSLSGDDKLWTISSNRIKTWLENVDKKTYLKFSDIGNIRVGIKTTADNVFIGNNWESGDNELELLKPLITHRDAGQIISPSGASWKVLYTHEVLNGKKVAIDINKYPKSKAYLENHYEQLNGRSYIKKTKRNWYEIWVPQNPSSFNKRKIVFRDISEKPQFWLDETSAIINGDCYWIEINNNIEEDLIYLSLAIANSSFIEKFYDLKFNTKLYSGKRRYISQYVSQFPIPDPKNAYSREAIDIVKKICNRTLILNEATKKDLDSIVNSIFS